MYVILYPGRVLDGVLTVSFQQKRSEGGLRQGDHAGGKNTILDSVGIKYILPARVFADLRRIARVAAAGRQARAAQIAAAIIVKKKEKIPPCPCILHSSLFDERRRYGRGWIVAGSFRDVKESQVVEVSDKLDSKHSGYRK